MITHEILDGIGDAIYALDPDWRIVFFNRQAEVFFGRDRKDLLGRSVWDCFPAARGTKLGVAMEEVMRGRKAVHLDVLSPSTGKWADTRFFPMENGGLAVSWRDITDQKRQAEDLAEATRNRDQAIRDLRTLVNHVPALIAYWDRNLKCRLSNDAYLEWFGQTAEKMIGISLRTLVGEDLYRQNEPYIKGALAGEPQGFERDLRKPNGELRHTWAQYIPDTDAKGKVRGFYAMVTDVSPLKETEDRLMAANALLQRAREEAEAATAAKSAFLSNMSHELRNPLTSIIGYAELLTKRGGLDEVQAKYVGRVNDASMALLATINDVLDFSKLEAGQVDIQPRTMDPLVLAHHALEMFEPQMAQKNLAHGLEAVGAPRLVLADDRRLRQILINLIGNAVKFTAAGSVTVRCQYDANAGLLRYEVVDTGPGIPADRQQRLFQRFSQLDASTGRTVGGTGLGLAICKGLAEAMGGQIGVLSIAGEGSCFWVEIPCTRVAMEGQEGSEDDEPRVLVDPLRGLRLLVVDDDPSNRELVRHMLEPLGIDVIEAPGGAEGVTIARSEAFDLILMDIRMPHVDGPTAAKLIRSNHNLNARTPMIAFTAEITGDMPSAWASLFDARLAKPIVLADLLSIVIAHAAPAPVAAKTA